MKKIEHFCTEIRAHRLKRLLYWASILVPNKKWLCSQGWVKALFSDFVFRTIFLISCSSNYERTRWLASTSQMPSQQLASQLTLSLNFFNYLAQALLCQPYQLNNTNQLIATLETHIQPSFQRHNQTTVLQNNSFFYPLAT